MALLEAVHAVFSYPIRWAYTLINVLISEKGYLHALLPLFVVGIAISAVLLGIKIIRKITWGT